MRIPKEHADRRAYHFSHIDNLPNLLRTGFLANNHKNFPQDSHRSIAAAGIQKRRAAMKVPCGPGGCVHDYVPLYFGARSPMLLGVINAKNIDQMDILYFEFPISLLNSANAVFTDASANTNEPPNFYSDPADMGELNWSEIDSVKWSSKTEALRHQRMAELLVYGELPLSAATCCVVWNDYMKSEVEKIVAASGAPFPPIEFESRDRYHWFNNFQENKGASIVTGPRAIAMHYESACESIAKEREKHVATASFTTLKALLEGLRRNFGCISHTAELVGLRSENGIHKRTVDIHTKEVVAKLLTLDEYQALNRWQKEMVELAAYLHDIGKGPRSRWDGNGGLQKVDPNHPVGAMPMMVDILANQVETVTQACANALTKLVCYHDLVGDVLGKGRSEQQIVDVVADEGELAMLFALCRADATALVEQWWNEDDAEELYERCLAAVNARTD